MYWYWCNRINTDEDQMGIGNKIQRTVVSLVLPEAQREARIEYLKQYSCKPPALFLLAISLVQIGIFVWDVVELSDNGQAVGLNGPPNIDNPLIFKSDKRYELWRFITYMFVHAGYLHLIGNVLGQLIIGIPLEMVHRWWRILLIYLLGGLAGSLGNTKG